MLTVMIGTNDICSDYCHDKTQGPEMHKKNLIKLLDYLYKKMPKTFVNLVVTPCTFEFVKQPQQTTTTTTIVCFTGLTYFLSVFRYTILYGINRSAIFTMFFNEINDMFVSFRWIFPKKKITNGDLHDEKISKNSKRNRNYLFIYF